jgi:hypothetical protein
MVDIAVRSLIGTTVAAANCDMELNTVNARFTVLFSAIISSVLRAVRSRLLLAGMQSRVIACIVPRHHQVLEILILHCQEVRMFLGHRIWAFGTRVTSRIPT